MLSRIKKNKGFTLLELIVVLVIIGILAAIAIPSYNAVKQNSAENAVTQSAEAVARNANAIAASSVRDNNNTTQDDIDDSIDESTADFTDNVVEINNGGACATSTVSLEINAAAGTTLAVASAGTECTS